MDNFKKNRSLKEMEMVKMLNVFMKSKSHQKIKEKKHW